MNYKKIFLTVLLVIAAIVVVDVIYVNWNKSDKTGNTENAGSNAQNITKAPAADNADQGKSEPPVVTDVPVNTEVTFYASETTKSPELEKAIKKIIDFPSKEDVEATRYYYNYIDLNDDGTQEVFVQLVGPYTSGSGGDTGLLFALSDDGFKLLQKFTLVTNPILISNQTTNGWHDIVMNITGGGATPGRLLMQYDGKAYPNPSDAPTLEDEVQVGGAAIISDDIAADLEAKRGLYLSY